MALHAVTFATRTPWRLDVLRAKTEGMIGSLIVQKLMNVLPPGPECATLLTRVEVNPNDPAFDVVRDVDGKMEGVEAVIDKDGTAALLVPALGADGLLMLTDVVTVFRDRGGAHQTAIARIALDALQAREFAPGSTGPKIRAACQFVRVKGQLTGISHLQDARAIVEGRADTQIRMATSLSNRRILGGPSAKIAAGHKPGSVPRPI